MFILDHQKWYMDPISDSESNSRSFWSSYMPHCLCGCDYRPHYLYCL